MRESPVTKSEFDAHFQGYGSVFKSGFQDFETSLFEHRERLRLDILARMEKLETTLLEEFTKFSGNFEAQLKANEALVFGFNRRLISVGERLSELERK